MSAVDWVPLAKDAVKAGDVVSADAGGMPIYRVIAVADGEVLLQDEQHAGVQRAPLDRLHWKAAKYEL